MTQTSLPITDDTYHGLHTYHGSKRDGGGTKNTILLLAKKSQCAFVCLCVQ